MRATHNRLSFMSAQRASRQAGLAAVVELLGSALLPGGRWPSWFGRPGAGAVKKRSRQWQRPHQSARECERRVRQPGLPARKVPGKSAWLALGVLGYRQRERLHRGARS